MKYRTKIVEIEAFQMTKETRATNELWPDWMHVAWNKDYLDEGSLSPINYPHSDGKDELALNRNGQRFNIPFGTWIIRQRDGSLVTMIDKAFQETYMAAA